MLNDDFLFEHKNKEYGAYKLRKQYKANVVVSLLISSITFFLIFFVPLIISLKKQYKDEIVINTVFAPSELLQLEKIEEPKIEELKPIQNKFNDVVVPKLNIDSTLNVDSASNKPIKEKLLNNLSSKTSENPETVHNDERLKHEPVFSNSSDQSVFRNWFYQNFKYPDSLKSKKISGKLVIQFTLDKKGLVDSVKIISSVYPAIDNEVKKVILNSPRWKPLIINGRQFKQAFIFPVFIMSRK